MRFNSITICTLIVFLAGGLTAQASENSHLDAAQEPVIADGEIPTPTVTARATEAIAPPEIIEEERFLQQRAAIDLQQDPKIEPSLAAQPMPTEVEGQAEPLAKVAPVADGVETQAEALRPNELIAQSLTNTTPRVADTPSETGVTCIAQAITTPSNEATQLAQGTPRRCPRPQAIPRLAVPEPVEESGASPALSIYIPVGYGADNNTVFLTGSYQASVREDEGSVGAGGIGIGLGDAQNAVGLELSYALETNDRSFGEGGFNVKVHRHLGQDLAGAVGWNGLLNITRNDFEQSRYAVLTKVFRTQDSLNDPFSRVSLTVGVGDGQFRSNGAAKVGDNNINAFGNVAVRVIRPVSFIAEWTGQDLALGLSIAPFKNIPFVITPAVRDLAGAGDEPRFVLGAGTALRF